MNIHRLFAAISVLVVGCGLLWGFAIVGSPLSARSQRLDERRVQDLKAIYEEIMNIVHEGRRMETPAPERLRQPLPASLADATARATRQRLSTRDPETGEPYEYQVLSPTRFQLCATFALERHGVYDVFWDHPAGRHCYTFDALDVAGPTKQAPAK